MGRPIDRAWNPSRAPVDQGRQTAIGTS